MNIVIKNATALFGSQVAGYAISLAVLPYLARALGAGGFGEWSFAMNAMTYVAVILEFGFTFYGAKEIAQNRGRVGEVVGEIYTAKAVLAIICLMAISALPSAIATNGVWYAAFFVSFAQTLSPIWLFQGLGHARVVAFFTIFGQAFAAILIITFVKTPSDAWLALLINALSFGFANLTALAYGVKKYNVRISVDPRFYKIFTATKSIFISNIAISMYISIVGVWVGFALNANESGEFFGAQKIILIINSLFIPLSQAIFPIMAQNKDSIFIKRLFKITALTLPLFCLILALFSNEITYILLGKDFDKSAHLLAIMSFTPFFVALNIIMGSLGLIAFGYDKNMRKATVITALVALPLSATLCFGLGAFGSALYMPLIEAIVFCALFYETRKLGIL